ncbi:MAG: peptidoglycan recognition family protein [Solirubrobacterales bacterium]
MIAKGIALAALALGLLAGGRWQAPGPVPAAGARPAAARPAPPRPRIHREPIPFGAKRKRQMARYAERHYGLHTFRLRHPRVIVEHFSLTPNLSALYNTFAPDRPDPELGELPNVCAHFGVGRGGRIVQFVSLRVMCRHTVGLNWTAIGIENVGYSDAQILGNRRQLRASLRLTAWLRCRFGIRLRDVIGHRESLRSPYHRERVAGLRHQTHGDWNHRDMNVFRRKLRRYRCGAAGRRRRSARPRP